MSVQRPYLVCKCWSLGDRYHALVSLTLAVQGVILCSWWSARLSGIVCFTISEVKSSCRRKEQWAALKCPSVKTSAKSMQSSKTKTEIQDSLTLVLGCFFLQRSLNTHLQTIMAYCPTKEAFKVDRLDTRSRRACFLPSRNSQSGW